MDQSQSILSATLGGGCFWCVEAVFQQMNGVNSVVSGYSGGKIKDPAYLDVSSGRTGHAEVIRIEYDSELVSYQEILEVFWRTHDPTTHNRQGGDIGPQYRSVVFYHDDEQKQLAEDYRDKLDKEGLYSDPIVTEISPLVNFFPAEETHQNYFINNPEKAYCQMVVKRKVEKFQRVFARKVKP